MYTKESDSFHNLLNVMKLYPNKDEIKYLLYLWVFYRHVKYERILSSLILKHNFYQILVQNEYEQNMK
jgi:hypothetical protein